MNKGKILKVVFLDHSSLDTSIIEEIKNCPQVIYSLYGRVLFEDKKFLTIACMNDNIDKMPEAYITSRRSFVMRIIKSTILEMKELKIIE